MHACTHAQQHALIHALRCWSAGFAPMATPAPMPSASNPFAAAAAVGPYGSPQVSPVPAAAAPPPGGAAAVDAEWEMFFANRCLSCMHTRMAHACAHHHTRLRLPQAVPGLDNIMRRLLNAAARAAHKCPACRSPPCTVCCTLSHQLIYADQAAIGLTEGGPVLVSAMCVQGWPARRRASTTRSGTDQRQR